MALGAQAPHLKPLTIEVARHEALMLFPAGSPPGPTTFLLEVLFKQLVAAPRRLMAVKFHFAASMFMALVCVLALIPQVRTSASTTC